MMFDILALTLHLFGQIRPFILYKCELFLHTELVLIWLVNCQDQIKVIKQVPLPSFQQLAGDFY
jgi:hypothetical protein